MKSLLSVSIALLLPLTAGAFPFGNPPLCERAEYFPQDVAGTSQPAPAGSDAQREASEAERPAWVDPKLVHKKVVVHLRDGRVLKGKVVELTDDFLRLKRGKRIEKIMLAEVASVERRRRNWKVPLIIIGAAVAVYVAIGLAVAGGEG